jgi:Fe-S cluster assembly protein SufD
MPASKRPEAAMIVKSETAPYVDAFRAAGRHEAAPLAERREAALRNFGDKGFPTRRQEAWRFTNLTPLQRTVFPPAVDADRTNPVIEAYRFAGAAHRLVFVNGRFAPQASALGELPEGARLASMAEVLAEKPALAASAVEESDTAGNQPFASLNAAFFADGFVLTLDPGVVLDRPVEIVHWADATAPRSHHLRNLVLLGAGSSAKLVESHTGRGGYWSNAVTAVRLAEGAALDHVKLQDESGEAIHLAVTRATLGKASRYESFALTLGARLSRHDMLMRLDGEGARLGLNGAYLLRRDQEATSATFVDHAAPGGTTRELFKGVVEERAHGVFLGTIGVRPDAQKTDAHQLNKNLLLSPRATVDTKPELEILADDVKCSHGATVGDLDENALFYLRARGIDEAEARRLLIEAFALDALDAVTDASLRAHLQAQLQRWLEGSRP